jgi:hypothetical protein
MVTVVPIGNVVRLVSDSESGDAVSDVGPLQTDLVGAFRSVPIETGA